MRALILLLIATSAIGQPIDYPTAGWLRDRIIQVCPISTVSVGDPARKETWRVLYLPEATAEQRSNAASIIATWTEADWNGPPSERRASAYRQRVDQWTTAIKRYEVLLKRIPDTPPNATRRAKIAAKMDAAEQRVVDLTTQIEAADPD